MEVITKRLRNSLGAVLMYVAMAITVVAAIAISITLVATNLYSRTANRSSDQQAYLLAKSIGQTFAAENQYVRNIVSYLSDHPSEKVTAKASVYFDPSTMTTATNTNVEYLSGMSVTDAYMSFYLSDKHDYLYGDVTVNYNGASATATLVMTCDAPASFERNMKSLFDNYDIYATQPNGMSFAMSAQSGDSVYPSVALYNDASTPASYSLTTDINANLTMTGPFQLQSSTTATRVIRGDVASYGDLQLYRRVEIPSVAGKYLTVNGHLTIGVSTTEKATVAVKRDVYCLNDVTVRTKAGDTNTIVTGSIYSEGNVTITNAVVSNIFADSGDITVSGGTVGNISTKGTVTLQNCKVIGTVYAGALKVTNSTITGNVTVQGANVAGSSILPQGDLDVELTAAATANQSIGAGSSSKIFVSGNLRVANYSSTRSLTLNGTVEVGGGIKNPLNSSGYPYLTTFNGSLLVRKGIKTEVSSNGVADYYNLSYLIGLRVLGDVVLDWSVPVFTAAGKDKLGNVASHYFTSSGLPETKATTVTGTLFVCTNGKGTDGLAGSFSLFKHPLLSNSAAFTIAIEGNQLMNGYLSYCDIYLNNAVLNNVAVGSASAYMGVATFGDVLVCGGTIGGSVYAHNIAFTDVTLSTATTQRILARTSNGNPGNIYLGTRTVSGTVTYLLDTPATRVGTPVTEVYGVVDATGNVAVGAGVHFISTAQLNCRQNLLLGGCDIDCPVVVGNTISNNSLARVYRNVRLGGTDSDHAFYVNGTLEVPQDGTQLTDAKTASAYVTALNMALTSNCPFLNVYVYGSRSGVEVGNGFTVTYMGVDGSNAAVTSLDKQFTVVYGTGTKADKADTHYILANQNNTSNVLNTSLHGSDPNQVLYFDCSATISGDLIFAGYVVVKEGASLTVTGNMRCRSVQNVASANIDNMSALIYHVDNAGSTHAMAYLQVSGTFQSTAERADLAFTNVSKFQNVLLATTGTVTFDDCDLAGDVSAANAEVKLQNYTYMAQSVSCRRFSAVDASFRTAEDCAIYASGDAVTINDCAVPNIYAKNARVDVRARSGVYGVTTIVAKQLVTDSVAINANGLYLLGEDESSCKNTYAGAYTIYVNYGDLVLREGSPFSEDVTVYYTGAGRVFHNGAIVSTAIELVEGSDEYNTLYQQIDLMCLAPHVDSLDDTIALVEYADLLSYDKQLVNYVAFTCPQYIENSQKVAYTEIASMGEMTITENTYWSEQALPLEWVFPSDTAYVSKTVDGEIVDLRNNGNSGDKMTVAYKALNLWDTASSFGQVLLDGLLGSFDAARESLNWKDLIPPYGDTIIRLARIVINHITTVVIPNMLSVSSVNSFAGISNSPDAYLRYYCNNYNSNVKNARGSADILVTSVSYLSTTSTAYNALASNSIVKWFLDRLDQNSDLIKVLKTLGWGGWSYIYRPCGVFFFNSGYVPEEVFSSYKTKDHSTYYSPSSANYRSRYTSDEKDSEGRWLWGGSGSASGSAADCTWTFFTCTDPANPYTSTAKDLHIVLPKHTYFTWLADKENCVRIIGNGRVFLYLQEDTNIKIVGNYWDNAMATKDAEVFGGLRYVGVLGGDTYYTYTSDRPTGVAYMDQKSNKTITVGGKSVTITPQLQPRMFLIGTGPHISLTVEDFQLAAYVYMPNGSLYTSSDWSGSAKYNSLILSNTSKSSAVQSDVYGMYVVDKIITQGQADYSVKYYPTSVDLSDTTIWYNATRVTGARDKNSGIAYYRLSEFWRYPESMPTSDLPWYYKGIAVN